MFFSRLRQCRVWSVTQVIALTLIFILVEPALRIVHYKDKIIGLLVVCEKPNAICFAFCFGNKGIFHCSTFLAFGIFVPEYSRVVPVIVSFTSAKACVRFSVLLNDLINLVSTRGNGFPGIRDCRFRLKWQYRIQEQ